MCSRRASAVGSVGWRNVPAGPVKVPTCSRSSCRGRGVVPGRRPVVVSMMRIEQQREPAQHDVGADAVFEAVVDRAQVQDLLHVPPAAFDLQELLVAQRDVLGGQVRVASSAAGTSRPGSPRRRSSALSMRSSPPGVTRRYRFRPGLVEIFPRSSPRFVAGSVSEPAISSVELGDQLLADVRRRGRRRRGCGRSRTARCSDDLHLLDPHVRRAIVLVAALPRQRGLDLRGVGAQLLADDVGVVALAQVAAVVLRRRTRGRRPRSPGQGPVPHVVLDLADQRRSRWCCRASTTPAPGSRRGSRPSRSRSGAGRRGSPWTCRRSGTRPCRRRARRRLPSSAAVRAVPSGAVAGCRAGRGRVRRGPDRFVGVLGSK